eukprot:m.137227 g.137227  ORF g.137227 m.137227 type:complete len:793 (+) comp14748_c0_seq2:111-2489(+)
MNGSNNKMATRRASRSTIVSEPMNVRTMKPMEEPHYAEPDLHKTSHKFKDPFVDGMYQWIKNNPTHSALLSEYMKELCKKNPANVTNTRLEFVMEQLQKTVAPAKSKKDSGRPTQLQEQLRKLEEKYKIEMSIMEDAQEFVRARAKLELEHAANLQRLAQQFHTKRKWPGFTYAKGHENILAIDLWRSIINLAMEDAKGFATSAEQLNTLSGDIFEAGKEEKRASFLNACQMLSNLQERLIKLDSTVEETRVKYMSAGKVFMKKKASRKNKIDSDEIRKAENSWQFSRQEYLLELAAANSQYLNFRNEQLPEVMDAAARPSLRFLSNFYKAYAGSVAVGLHSSLKNVRKIERLAVRLSPEFERRTFLHTHRFEFPGRQMFELTPCPGDEESNELMVTSNSRQVLIKIRALLKHSVEAIEQKLSEMEKKMQSLQGLQENFVKAGNLVDQAQLKGISDKMRELHAEIENEAFQVSHLKAKIDRITEAGVDRGESPVNDVRNSVIDLEEAQTRELAKRNQEQQRLSKQLDTPKGNFKGKPLRDMPANIPVQEQRRLSTDSKISQQEVESLPPPIFTPDFEDDGSGRVTVSPNLPPPVWTPDEESHGEILNNISRTSTGSNVFDELADVEVPPFYRTLYDYNAAEPDDLSISAGEDLYLLISRDDGWCQGLNDKGHVGFFPQTYVEKVADPSTVKLNQPRTVRLPPCSTSSLSIVAKENRPPIIDKVSPESIAYKVGLRPGDMLVEVDESPCCPVTYGQISSWLAQNEAGQSLKFCVITPNLPRMLPNRGSSITLV